MLRVIGFLVLAVLLANVLAHLPLVGPVFRSTGIFGIWIAALLLSLAVTRLTAVTVRRRKDAHEVRRLEAVDSAYNGGKLGSLYLAQGRARRAIEPLQRAVAGEPEVAEWHYRLAQALAKTGDRDGALASIERCLALEEEHAYGQAQLQRAAWSLAAGRADDALEALATFERNHGPTPESAYRRGRAQRAAGNREEARRAFGEVAGLTAQAPGYQRRAALLWSLRAWFAGRA